MKILLLITCLFIFPFVGLGQENIAFSYYRSGKIRKASNFNSSLRKDFTCSDKGDYRGKIKSIGYADDEITPVFLIIQMANLRRLQIGLDEESIETFSESDRRNWEAQVVKNTQVIIKAFACGAGGNSDLQISSIEFK